MESGVIIFVGDGKGSDALEPFFKRLNRSSANIDVVIIDMSPAFINAVNKHLACAPGVFDHSIMNQSMPSSYVPILLYHLLNLGRNPIRDVSQAFSSKITLTI